MISVKGIIFTDFVNYKLPCMTIMTPVCKDFKCDRECGHPVCQNGELAASPTFTYTIDSILSFYLNDSITKAICFQGLEPFDTFNETLHFIKRFREVSNDDIVIYTGYTEDEIEQELKELAKFSNIVVKFGRYIPNQVSHLDETLQVKLASPNQYARRIS